MNRRRDPGSLRKKKDLLLQECNKCCFCEIELSRDNATIEHIIPRGKGESNQFENLTLSCYECNNLRGNIPFEEFKYITEFVQWLFPSTRKMI